MKTKICKKCGIEKPATIQFFWLKKKTQKSGYVTNYLYPSCIECNRVTAQSCECKVCGAKFIAKRIDGEICSSNCRNIWKMLYGMYKKSCKLKSEKCKWCGHLFDAYKGSVFCSDLCRTNDRLKRQQIQSHKYYNTHFLNKVVKKCATCGSEYVTTMPRRSMYCSEVCKKARNNRYHMEYYRRKMTKICNKKKMVQLAKQQRDQLCSPYIVSLLKRQNIDRITPEIIELKREQLKLNRQINEKQRAINNS